MVAIALCHVLVSLHAQEDIRASVLFDDMYRNSWTVREGVPPGLWQVRQATDGFLWLATETGLYRFDGIAFTKYVPPNGQKLLKEGPITALAATSDGGLWIAYRFGGTSFIHHGAVTNYPAAHNFTETFFILVEDRDGNLWGATSTGLFRYHDGLWSRVDVSLKQPINHVNHVRLMASGDLWVDDGTTYSVLFLHGKLFQNTGLPSGKLDITGANIGWLSRDGIGLFPVLRGTDGVWSVGKQILKENISSITHTRDGSLWFGAHDGIWRIRNINAFATEPFQPSALQSVRKTDGLSGDFVYALTVDREGSVWALTPNGLDQFRKTTLSSVALPPDMQHPFLIDEGTSVLVGTAFYSSAMLARVSQQGVESIPTPSLSLGIHQMYRDSRGGVWINAAGKLWFLTGKKIVPVKGPPGLADDALKIHAITMDHAGTLWMSVLLNGSDKIYMLAKDGSWSEFHGLDGYPSFVASSMMTDHAGSIWVATGTSRIFKIEGNHVQSFDRRQGVDSGGVTLLDEVNDHIWIGGAENLDYFSKGRFRRISYEDGSPIAGTTGVAETPDGDVWLNCARGILRITGAEIRNALLQDKTNVHTTTFNYLDGAFETPVIRLQSSTIAHTQDGRIYFLGRQGLSWIDPSHLQKNDIPPGVVVTSMTVDGRVHENPSALRLEKGVQNLQINYTATSLLIPERVRFRYKLEGFDPDWQDVGTRRAAYYTHLPPGRYAFRVMASNNDGVWSVSPASLDFYLPPTFLQSIWFKILCFVTLAGIFSTLYLFRIRFLTAQIRQRLFERLAERERIARDLHDTFFQGIQGLFLRFNTGAAMLSAEEPARRIFMDALEQSDRVMAEGRELVLDLRSDDTVTASLAEDLARVGQQPSEAPLPAYKVFAIGQVRPVHPVCGTELLRIGQEAVHNAFKHANAGAVEVEVLYEKEFLKMRIRDDGQGMDEKVIREGRRPGHLGLIGMNERAARIGARYRLWSKKGQGTEIEVEVPAKIAYAGRVPYKQKFKAKRGGKP
jgi:signal transduction histidine kinase/ligand-binding sensor domain-containing protein